jgi:hypothetical protein
MDKPDTEAIEVVPHHQPLTIAPEDEVDPSAVGGTIQDLPEGYYRSYKFIGTVGATVLITANLFIELVFPVSPPCVDPFLKAASRAYIIL